MCRAVRILCGDGRVFELPDRESDHKGADAESEGKEEIKTRPEDLDALVLVHCVLLHFPNVAYLMVKMAG